tara:strand:- start:1725 stop:1889 length:165 start_codon:yes stop_codon:yes gene_type:complete
MIKDGLWVNIPKNYGYNGFTSKIDKVINLKLKTLREKRIKNQLTTVILKGVING